MKKAFGLVLAFVFVIAGITPVNAEENETNSSSVYALDEEKAQEFEVNQAEKTIEIQDVSEITATEEKPAENTNEPKIVTEKTATGQIEKLISPDGKVIAEKTIEKDKVIKKVLNFYYPNGKLMRQVVSAGDDKGFYAEEYYSNGKISSQATYVNEKSKIGKEKKYDSNGVLRQEVPWILPKEELKKPIEERKSIRRGNVITYYPNGKIAASFPVGAKGKTIFFDNRGYPLREIADSEILNFSKELTPEDCQGASIQLSLDDLVELYEDEGDISYNKCGLPYRENFVYEIIEDLGRRENKLSYDETGMLRRMTTYENGLKHGLERKYDGSGNLTAEINYKNGVKDGYANGYFPTKEKAFTKRYENGKVVDTLKCYFPTGELAAEFNYKNGLKEGKAIVNSPVKREMTFFEGELLNKPAENKRRQLVSAISGLRHPDEQCLNIGTRVREIERNINSNTDSFKTTFEIKIPRGCEDISQFKAEHNQLICYDNMQKIRATAPAAYRRNDFAIEKIYSPNGLLMYSISYMKQLRQGLTKKYNELGKVTAEMYFDRGQLAESSRSFYPDGKVKDLINYAEDAPRKLLARYREDGSLLFSLTYKGAEKQEAYINSAKEGKDIVLRYYKGKPDSIRESNVGNPYNFMEYNLALGEYAVYRNNRLIKGGKLCDYQVAEDVDVITLKTEEKAQEATVTEPTPEVVAVKELITETEVKEPEKEIVEVKETVTETEVKEPQNEIVEVKETVAEAVVKEPESASEEVKLEEKDIVIEEKPVKKEVDEKQQLEEISDKAEQTISEMSDTVASILNTLELPEPPVMSEDMAPVVEDIEPVESKEIATPVKDNTINEALLPTESEEEKHQAELAAKNIGPVVKPDIEQMTAAVQKEKIDTETKSATLSDESQTEKFYYPNGSLRKTVKTKGTRTEEVKEYSKNGQLLTKTIYDADKITIEKYFSSGEVRRRTEKTYDDNAVNAFISREDFYDNGKPRYEIKHQPNSMLFSEKTYYPDGKVKTETTQVGALTFRVKEYDEEGKVTKEVTEPQIRGLRVDKNRQSIMGYNAAGKPETDVSFYNNGEIVVRTFTADGNTIKFAYVAQDGKLYFEKPEMRVIPSYRVRYWVDYNNPLWVENQDKYSVKSIAKLNLDIAARVLEEMGVSMPSAMKGLEEKY